MPLIYVSPEEEQRILKYLDELDAWLLPLLKENNLKKELKNAKKREQELTQELKQLQEKQPPPPIPITVKG